MTTLTTAQLDYQRIAEAFVHPLKLRILRAYCRATATAGRGHAGARVVARTASGLPGEPLGNVSYHVRQLEKAGLIELVATRQRRGALEHYYTLV